MRSKIRYIGVAFAVLLIAACSQVVDRISFSDPVSGTSLQQIYVTSGRLPATQPTDLKRDRAAKPRFVRYDISIPPVHQLGQIEWPKDAPDPTKHFTVTDLTDFGDSSAFMRAIEAEPGNDVAIYVHGYNNTPSEALYRFAQIGHDFELSMPQVLFSWPSAGKATGYVYDRDSVLFSRDPLANLLTQISRHTSKKITLMAHSMGAHLTMEVFRQLALTGRRDVLGDLDVVALWSPDIDPDVFRAQANAVGTLPDPFVIMTSQTDRALKLSAFLNIGRQKVGDLSGAKDIAGLNVTLFDFTTLADGSNLDHLIPMSSPTAIAVLRDLVRSDSNGTLDLTNFDVGEDGVIRTKSIDRLAGLPLLLKR